MRLKVNFKDQLKISELAKIKSGVARLRELGVDYTSVKIREKFNLMPI
ncbi:MAG: hypothetical protein WD059_13430 [Balneolaceae bacterium]